MGLGRFAVWRLCTWGSVADLLGCKPHGARGYRVVHCTAIANTVVLLLGSMLIAIGLTLELITEATLTSGSFGLDIGRCAERDGCGDRR